MKKLKDVMWAIKGVYGLYAGTWFTRSEAIRAHCSAKGWTWKECKSKGDAAVYVSVKEIALTSDAAKGTSHD